MTLEISRRQVGNIWRTGAEEEGTGASATAFASYDGDPVNLPSFDDKHLPFTNLTTGTDLLDRSTLDQPTFLAEGLYVISTTVNGSGGGDGPVDIRLLTTSQGLPSYPSGAELTIGSSLSGPFQVEAGDVLRIFCSNHGPNAIDLVLGSAYIAKIG